jgi:hypothetical protein
VDSVSPYRNLRVNAVAGVRALSFMTVRGFDALTAAQDVAQRRSVPCASTVKRATTDARATRIP